MRNVLRHGTIAIATAAACLSHAASPTVAASPAIPTYGQQVEVGVNNSEYPFFLPATRFTRNGSQITVEYEYSTNGWDVGTPAYGLESVGFGELPPGTYTVTALLHDHANPSNVTTSTTNMPVLPPQDWGIYSVPVDPQAFTPIYATIRSAVYYDPTSMKVTVSGDVVRIDFDYYSNAPTGGAAPAGSTSYGAVKVDGLAPGNYTLQAWGRAKSGGDSQLYFTRAIQVATTSPVIEYYAPSTKHYFMSAGPSDIAGLDPGTVGWLRSGQQWKAWLRQQDAPPGAMPVCRFYAGGPNSHFYTANPADCQGLKDLEQQQRAALAPGQPFLGWQFEQIAFYALVPVNGQCPGDTMPVYRAYNNRFAENDSNHRFMIDPQMRAAELSLGWGDEGVQFCSPL
jgi:serine protease